MESAILLQKKANERSKCGQRMGRDDLIYVSTQMTQTNTVPATDQIAAKGTVSHYNSLYAVLCEQAFGPGVQRFGCLDTLPLLLFEEFIWCSPGSRHRVNNTQIFKWMRKCQRPLPRQNGESQQSSQVLRSEGYVLKMFPCAEGLGIFLRHL